MSICVKLISILVSLFIFIVALVGFNFHTFDELKGDSPMVNASHESLSALVALRAPRLGG